jgi:SAM-dependent methyltransferase
MVNIKQALTDLSAIDLNQRKNWYSPAAVAYNEVRPPYPQDLIRRAMAAAQLSADARILEIGCGPGTATVALAPWGCELLCLEPNVDFYRLAQENCGAYPQITFANTSFEEWEPGAQKFDGVLAASSFHWIPAEVGYPKAAAVLKPGGALLLFWNKELQPSYEIHQRLSPIYQELAPALDRYEDTPTQMAILEQLGQMVLDSGRFENLVAGQEETKVNYSIDQYLLLLNTYSPYLKLETEQKQKLFGGLRRILEAQGNTIELSNICAFHVASSI